MRTNVTMDYVVLVAIAECFEYLSHVVAGMGKWTLVGYIRVYNGAFAVLLRGLIDLKYSVKVMNEMRECLSLYNLGSSSHE